MEKNFRKKRVKAGQIWVETVIYTLIAFVMIGAVLAIAQPKIQEIQDKTFIEQSIGVMKDMNNIIVSIDQAGAGNKRLVELGLKKGTFTVNAGQDIVVFEIDSTYSYSEPGTDINEGSTLVHTRERGDEYVVNITQNYGSKYNITYAGADGTQVLSSASNPYRIFISNEGKDSSNKTIINFDIG